jgi:general secretion pathway protein G
MRYARGEKGFTLVEMLTVLFIVSILLGIVLGSARYATQVSRVSRAESDMHTLAEALDRFHLVFGDYPDVESATNLVSYARRALGGEEADRFHFRNLLPAGFTAVDPWSHPYIYRVYRPDKPGEGDFKASDETIYALASAGPDGKEGTDDDIVAP